eukprot:4391952-Pyramimonas_sp.AAC.1
MPRATCSLRAPLLRLISLAVFAAAYGWVLRQANSSMFLNIPLVEGHARLEPRIEIRRRARGGNEKGRAFSEGSEVPELPEEFSSPSPKRHANLSEGARASE